MNKILSSCVLVLFCLQVFADEKGMDLFEEIDATMINSMNEYESALKELIALNEGSDLNYGAEDIDIKYPSRIKDNISKKISQYLSDMNESINKAEKYMRSRNQNDCLDKTAAFRKQYVPALKKNLQEYNAMSVANKKEREVTWAKTMSFTLTGPAQTYGILSLDTFVQCLVMQ